MKHNIPLSSHSPLAAVYSTQDFLSIFYFYAAVDLSYKHFLNLKSYIAVILFEVWVEKTPNHIFLAQGAPLMVGLYHSLLSIVSHRFAYCLLVLV